MNFEIKFLNFILKNLNLNISKKLEINKNH